MIIITPSMLKTYFCRKHAVYELPFVVEKVISYFFPNKKLLYVAIERHNGLPTIQ